MNTSLRRILYDLKSASREDEILSIGHRAADIFGFDHMSYLAVAGGEAAFISDYPTEWLSIYADNDFATADPVVKIAKDAPSPYLWDQRLGERHGPAAMNVFDAARDFGIMAGLSIPIASRGKGYAVVTLAGTSNVICNRKDVNEMGLCLRAIGMAFHNSISTKIERFANHNRDLNLTEQQGACLEAVAIGYSTKAIARLMNVTPRTVSFHLEAAKQRLSAQTLSEAVAIAVRHRIIL